MESPAAQHRPRSAKSVEDMADRRISSLSTTSGCSDCTTDRTLQGAKSYGSSFFEDETPRLLGDSDDNTSVSSDDDFSSNHSQVGTQGVQNYKVC